MLVIGHRGAAGLKPENTVKSFVFALELGVDMLECDVRLTKDGHVVIMHDATVDRTTNGTGKVAEMTLEEIRHLDAGDGEQVPVLSEYLDLLAERNIPAEVEVKAPEALEPALQLIREYGLVDRICITSNLDVLTRARELEPSIDLGVPSGNPSLDDVKRAASIGARSVGVHYKHITAEIVSACHERSLEVRGWNPKTKETTELLMSFGVDAITTDRPDIALSLQGRLRTQNNGPF